MKSKKIILLLLPFILIFSIGAVNLINTRIVQVRYGLSGDTKATSIPYGSEYYETDTSKNFVYTSAGWVQKYNQEVDPTTGAICVIGIETCKLHSGDSYVMTMVDTVASGDSLILAITVPDTSLLPHFHFSVEETEQTLLRVFESASAAANTGVEKTPINNNRNSANASVLTAIVGPTITVDEDSLIYEYLFGYADTPISHAGGVHENALEFILERDRTYAWLIISKAADNYITAVASWHEHTNRN